jgi:hypothetical protein
MTEKTQYHLVAVFIRGGVSFEISAPAKAKLGAVLDKAADELALYDGRVFMINQRRFKIHPFYAHPETSMTIGKAVDYIDRMYAMSRLDYVFELFDGKPAVINNLEDLDCSCQ